MGPLGKNESRVEKASAATAAEIISVISLEFRGKLCPSSLLKMRG